MNESTAHARAKQVYLEVRERPPGERQVLLRSLTSNDPELHDMVSVLLDADRQPDDLTAPPPEVSELVAALSDTSLSDSWRGVRIGHYRILRPIARGGMGSVFVATQEHLRRNVAIKLMSGRWDSPEALARFTNESRALARLSHPAIAHIFEAGVHELDLAIDARQDARPSVPYLAMELVEDASAIDVYSRHHGLSVPQRLRVFLRVCEAVEYGHQRGVMHGDLKPANILLDRAGQVKLVDFGIARVLEEPTAGCDDRSGSSAAGTHGYMSPERFRGDALPADPRSDIYSLGIVLRELLASAAPREGTADGRRATLSVSAAPFARQRDIDAILLRATHPDAERRYQSVRALAIDIENTLTHRPIAERKGERSYSVRLFARRHRTAIGAAIACLAAAAFGLLGMAVAVREARRAERAAAARADESERGAYLQGLSSVQNALRSSHVAAARSLLDTLPDNGWEHGHLRSRLERSDEVWRIFGRSHPTVLEPSPADDRLAALDADGILWIGSGPDPAAWLSVPTGAREWSHPSLCWSRDGSSIATGGTDGFLRVWDASSGALRWESRVNVNNVTSLAYSPDDRLIATGDWARSVKLWDAATGAKVSEFPPHADIITSLAFSPDGTSLASGSADRTARIWTRHGSLLATLNQADGEVTSVAFSDDGRWAATGSLDGNVRLYRTSDWSMASVFAEHRSKVGAVRFDRSGDRLASNGHYNDLWIRRIPDGEDPVLILGNNPRFGRDGARLFVTALQSVRVYDSGIDQELTQMPWFLGSLAALSPDGARFVTVDHAGGTGAIKTWDAYTLEELLTLRGHEGTCTCADWSPDGERIASGGLDGTLRFWDPDSGTEVARFAAHRGAVRTVRFNPTNPAEVYTAGEDGAVRGWDPITSSQSGDVMAHPGGVWAIRVHPRSGAIVTCGNDGRVRAWNHGLTRELWSAVPCVGSDRAVEPVYSAAFDPSGDHLVVGSTEQLAILASESGTVLAKSPASAGGIVHSVAYTPEADRVLSLGHDGVIRVHDAADLRLLLTLDDVLRGYRGQILLHPSRAGDPHSGQLALLKARAADRAEAAVSPHPSPFPVLREADRRRALTAQYLLNRLEEACGVTEEVLARLGAPSDEDPQVVEIAARIARRRGEHAEDLRVRAWLAVRLPGTDAIGISRAMRQAQRARDLEPEDHEVNCVLGIAQYRAGDYAAAARTLQLAATLRTARSGAPSARESAFLAMSFHKLGELSLAAEQLAVLSSIADASIDVETQQLLREARNEIDGEQAPPGARIR